MKAGQGCRWLPAWEGESVEHYLWRLVRDARRKVGPEPPVRDEPAKSEKGDLERCGSGPDREGV